MLQCCDSRVSALREGKMILARTLTLHTSNRRRSDANYSHEVTHYHCQLAVRTSLRVFGRSKRHVCAMVCQLQGAVSSENDVT